MLILDINDCELQLWRQRDLLLQSPGYAYLRGSEYQYGEAARGQARLHPRDINHRFWWQLDTEPLQPSYGPARHSADLVHGHLLDIHQRGDKFEQVLLSVPGSMQQDQLSLLLGIIEQCPFSVCGLVDRAIARTCGKPLASRSWHLELQLHQALLTEMRVSDGQVQREHATAIPGSGWLAIQDSMANAVADSFIRQTRFDPRRKAATEQQLYGELPNLLRQLSGQREYNLELGGHRARVEYDKLAQTLDSHFQRLSRGQADAQAQLWVDRDLSLLPGLTDHLQNAQALDASDLCDNIERHQALIIGDGEHLHFITSLPATLASSPAPTPATTVQSNPAEQAPLTAATEPAPRLATNYRIEFANNSYTLIPGPGEAPLLNGQPVSQPRVLSPGDSVDCGDGQVLQLTQLAGEHGPQA